MYDSIKEASEYRGKVQLTFWDKQDLEEDTFMFEKIGEAIRFVEKVAYFPERYPAYFTWSIADKDGYWIIETGEDHIPLK